MRRRRCGSRIVGIALVAAVVAGMAGASPAGANIGFITTYYDFTAHPAQNTDYPFDIVQGPDGNLWYTAGNSDRIGRITPAGAFTTFPLPEELTSPEALTVGVDGNLWFTGRDSGTLGRMTPAGVATVFGYLDENQGEFHDVGDLITGPDGNLWMVDYVHAELIRFDPDTEQVTVFADSGVIPAPLDAHLAPGPDGNVWFTDYTHDRVGRIDLDTFAVETFTGPTVDGPFQITSGPGGDLWFSSYQNDRIGRIDPDTEVVTTYPHPGGVLDRPSGITAGPDGNVWFLTENPAVGRITPAGQITLYEDDDLLLLRNITAGPDNAVWFTDSSADRIGRASTVPVMGSITIQIDARPNNARDFTYSVTGAGLSPFSLDDDANATLPSSRTFTGLSAGTYTVAQGAVSGWTLADLSCPGQSVNLGTRTATIDLEVGENITCTFGNARRRPDLAVATGTGAFVGDDVYATSATTGQTASSNVAAGATKTFRVRIGNDGGAAESIRVTAASSGSAGYTVRYFRADNNVEITSFITTATGSTFPNMPAGGFVDIKVKITATTAAARGSTRSATITARSTTFTTITDVVRAKVTRT